MLNGHGDDTYKYKDIRINFSSNVYNHFCHDGLYAHLASRMDCIRNYPQPTPSDLEKEIASLNYLSPENVIVTNGATEAIYLIAQAFAQASSLILQPTFTEYEDACRIFRHEIKPLTPTLSPPQGKGVFTFSRNIDSLSAILSNSLAPSGERAGVRGCSGFTKE